MVARIVKLHRKVSKIEAWPPLWKLCIRFDHTKGMFFPFFSRLEPRFRQKIGRSLSENLFFFVRYLILGKESD